MSVASSTHLTEANAGETAGASHIAPPPARAAREAGRAEAWPVASRDVPSPAGLASRAPSPIFVVGAQRSGTTMLRLMLNCHRRLAIPFESGFLRVLPAARKLAPLSLRENQERLARALANEPFTKKGEVLTDIDAVLEHEIHDFGSFIDAVFTTWAESRGKARWGVKMPPYVLEMDEILEHLPTTQFIHIVRDGRDVALSYSRLPWGPPDIIKIATDWRMKVTLGHKMGRLLGPQQYLEIKYEDLVLDPRDSLERICDFVDEDFDPAMLDYYRTAIKEMPSSSIEWHKNSITAPNRSKVFAWKRELPTFDQILFEAHAGDALAMFGYDCEHRRPTLRSRLKNIWLAAGLAG